jgi:hypothetical protein
MCTSLRKYVPEEPGALPDAGISRCGAAVCGVMTSAWRVAVTKRSEVSRNAVLRMG